MKSLICCALVALAYGSSLALAGDCCQHCGCQCECQKVCRLVCETKKVTKVCYGCECEDFCVPGPSERTVCHDCECGKKHVQYTPTCAEVRTRRVLVKRETTEEKPSYKWVVETVCDACAGQCAAQTAENRAQQAAAKPHSTGDVALASHEVAQRPSPSVSTLASQSLTGLKSQLNRVLGPTLSQK